MPVWLRSEKVEQPPATPGQDLCTFAIQQMSIREMCRKEDYPEDGFNEISPALSENLISALSKLTTYQEQKERQLKNMDEKLQASNSAPKNQESENRFQNLPQQQPYSHNSQNRSFANFSGNFCPRFQNRGLLTGRDFQYVQGTINRALANLFNKGVIRQGLTIKMIYDFLQPPTCQLRKQVKHFAIFADNQIK